MRHYMWKRSPMARTFFSVLERSIDWHVRRARDKVCLFDSRTFRNGRPYAEQWRWIRRIGSLVSVACFSPRGVREGRFENVDWNRLRCGFSSSMHDSDQRCSRDIRFRGKPRRGAVSDMHYIALDRVNRSSNGSPERPRYSTVNWPFVGFRSKIGATAPFVSAPYTLHTPSSAFRICKNETGTRSVSKRSEREKGMHGVREV